MLSQPSNIEYVKELLESKEVPGRSKLAELVCDYFDFHDARGHRQKGSCLKALRELEAAGYFVLPPVVHKKTGGNSLRRLSEPVPEPKDVPAKAGDIWGLSLVAVRTEEQVRIWNELMICEHPQGAGPFVGRQLRYLIGSENGWLGGLGFAASALYLSPRDKWIGWNHDQRKAYLHTVVGMSRFLIRKSVDCHNLASKVLGMAMKALPDDFERKYGFRPWLVESFVDTSYYRGSCYKASNWILLGKTKGRGRQDRLKKSALSRKDIYLFPLVNDFRKRMGLNPTAGMGALGPVDGMETDTWAENEFGGAPIGDIRLGRRLVAAAAAKAKVPNRAFTGVAKGDWPTIKGYYRMIDKPDESAVSMENILLPHREQTIRRMQGQKTVLCIQDGSDLNYNNLAQCEGLGIIGTTNQTGVISRGLHLHSTLVVAPDGIPLGVLKAQCVARKEKSPDEKRKTHDIPIEEKKTFIWIEHHRDMVKIAADMPNTRVVDVCDREADFFELFDEQRRHPRVDLLVRAKHDRNIDIDKKLFKAVREAPVQSRVRIRVPRKSSRPKRSKQKASPARAGRTSDFAVRCIRVRLNPPPYFRDKAPIELQIIHAHEENPPANTKPIEWFLLTTVNIKIPEDAEQCLRWYCLRWRIEDWHRVLKFGCGIENIAHKTAERLRRAIAINLVIAWRIMLMTLMGRETPELPAEVLFSDIELRTLRAYAKKKGLPLPVLLGEAVKLVAKIGGYIGRRSDPPPGHQLLWQGYAEFQFMCMGFALLEEE